MTADKPRGRQGVPCTMCGYHFGAGDLVNAWAVVCFRGTGSFYGTKRVRWPHRKRAGVICPECRHVQVLVTAVSRDLLEMA